MLHLIHPALVHFSIALLILGGVSEVWGLLARSRASARWGGRLVLVGLVSLIPTIVSGYLAANTLELAAAGLRLLGSHEKAGLVLLGLAVASQFWKAWCGGRIPEGQSRRYALLVAMLVLSTIYSAWLGGLMVYGHGVGVLPSG